MEKKRGEGIEGGEGGETITVSTAKSWTLTWIKVAAMQEKVLNGV